MRQYLQPTKPEALSGDASTRSSLKSCTDYALQIGVVSSFFVSALTLNFAVWLLDFLGYRKGQTEFWQRVIQRSFQSWLGFACKFGAIRLDTKDLEKLRDIRGQIVVANHPGLLDAVILLSYVPRGVCIMRSDLRRDLTLRALSRLAGYISNDKGTALIREGIAHLRKGDNIVVFPEGTRTQGKGIGSFKSGFALMAIRASAPVQSVLVSLQGIYFRKGTSLWRPVPAPVRIAMELGPLFTAGPNESASSFSKRLEKYYQKTLSKKEANVSTHGFGCEYAH